VGEVLPLRPSKWRIIVVGWVRSENQQRRSVFLTPLKNHHNTRIYLFMFRVYASGLF
jgi:hypothetical protein